MLGVGVRVLSSNGVLVEARVAVLDGVGVLDIMIVGFGVLVRSRGGGAGSVGSIIPGAEQAKTSARKTVAYARMTKNKGTVAFCFIFRLLWYLVRLPSKRPDRTAVLCLSKVARSCFSASDLLD